MKQPKILLLAILIPVAFSACKRDGFDKTDSGLRYKMHTKNTGPKPKEGDVLTLNMSYKKLNPDSVLFDTYKAGTPVKVPLQKPSFKGGIEEGFAMLSVGDSATFKISADSLFLKTFHSPQLPPFIKPGSDLLFTVKLEKIQTRQEIESEYRSQQEAAMKAAEERKGLEAGEIADYVKQNNINVKPTATGLYIVVKQQGKGAQAAAGKTVTVNYTGRLVDGKIFDTSVESVAKEAKVYDQRRKYSPIEIKLGENSVIPGWEEALKTMKEGGKSTVIIPSSQGYGAQGAGGVIPPYAPLVFDIELVSVK